MENKELLYSLYQSVSQLRFIDVNDRSRSILDTIKGAYRGVFGREYVNNDQEIIAEEVRRDIKVNGVFRKDNETSFYDFLKNHHCCWIDFIGCDSFSSRFKTQVFFSNVSMTRQDVKRKRVFLNEYNARLRQGVPVDVFVQLFFISPGSFYNLGDQRLLKSIQERGLLISFDSACPSSDDPSQSVSGLITKYFDCPRVLKEEEVDELGFDNMDYSEVSLKNEISKFLVSLQDGSPASPFAQKIALLNRSLHEDVKYLYFFPMHGADGAIGLYCYGANTLLEREERRELLVFAYNILSPFVSAYKSSWENQQIVQEAVKSAISAIMSRNMSHNLGSHCMHYTRTALENLAGRAYGHGPDLRGAAKLMAYIQARMDFVATMVSGEVFPYGAVNFKSQILDVLTIDDFSKRHYPSSDTATIYRRIKENNIQKELETVSQFLKKLRNDPKAEVRESVLKKAVSQTEGLIASLGAITLDDSYLRTTNFLLENLIKSEHFYRDDIPVQSQGKHFYLYVRYNNKLFTGAAIKPTVIRPKIRQAERIIKKLDAYLNSRGSSEKNNEIWLFLGQLQNRRLQDPDNQGRRIRDIYKTSLRRNALKPRIKEEMELLRQSVAHYSRLLTQYDQDNSVKAQLANLSIAMPGGIMSTHAFFNILENLIRNSAKHRISDLKGNDLVTTIDIVEVPDKSEYQFTIYDNKANAGIVIPIIEKQLCELRVLNKEDSSINKKSKGIKEMLVSALWLKANERNSNYFDLLIDIEQEDGSNKVEKIKNYAFELLGVDDEGNPSEAPDANMGLRFTLPKFEYFTTLTLESQGRSTPSLIRSIKQHPIHADIIQVPQRSYLEDAKKWFPRFVFSDDLLDPVEVDALKASVAGSMEEGTDCEAVKKLYGIMKRRFGRIVDDHVIVFDEDGTRAKAYSPESLIYFRRHFSEKNDFSDGLRYLYADSVSGGNFTVTLKDIFLDGIEENGQFKTWKDRYNALKIAESAMTRITLIDERLSNDRNELELTMKNIRVLNLNPEAQDESQIWSGNSFKDNDDYTLFLSIHLGLIEKVIENDDNWFMRQYKEAGAKTKRVDRARFFMDLLRKKFGKDKEIFISIHSGRGNYSYELEHSLKSYPFINLSALESVFSNSKYLLSQLFYNTIYIGKGEYNKY